MSVSKPGDLVTPVHEPRTVHLPKTRSQQDSRAIWHVRTHLCLAPRRHAKRHRHLRCCGWPERSFMCTLAGKQASLILI
jgi:hypothetical protein